MKRKIMQLGNSTNVISLPSSWIKENNLTKGDSIDLTLNEGAIIIKKTNNNNKKSIFFDLRNKPTKLILAYIESAYIAGYSKIKIQLSKDPDPIILKFSDMLFGFIVISYKNSILTLGEVSNTNEEELDTIINRTVYLYLNLMDQITKAIKDNDTETLKKIESKDKNLNKYQFYCSRIIINSCRLTESKKMIDYIFIQSIENLFDNFVKLVKIIIKDKIKNDEEKNNLVSDLSNINKYLRTYVKFFQSFNLSYSEDMVELKEYLRNKFKSRYYALFTSLISEIYSNYLTFLPYLIRLRKKEESSKQDIKRL